jgi:hypothetical protein
VCVCFAGVEFRISYILGKHSTTELPPKLLYLINSFVLYSILNKICISFSIFKAVIPYILASSIAVETCHSVSYTLHMIYMHIYLKSSSLWIFDLSHQCSEFSSDKCWCVCVFIHFIHNTEYFSLPF